MMARTPLLSQLMARKHQLKPLYVRARVAPQLAGASAALLSATALRELLARHPEWIENLLAADDPSDCGVYNIGGGPANTMSIWREFGPMLAACRRALATGELIVFVDDDVQLHPEALERFAEAFEEPSLLAAWGENGLSLHNIALSSGTVSVRGEGIPEDHEVYVAGRQVPVDKSGSFVTEHILPEGAHTVEVAVVDEEGAGELYLRDLEFKENDWFYVGMADVTLSDDQWAVLDSLA